MQHSRHRNGRIAADTTGVMLGTIIVVLAVLDLLIWATLWNVPNPISKRLVPQAVSSPALQPVRFAEKDGTAERAMLADRAPRTLPRSRLQ
jgi:hypothetical protein